jgi:hypothetical protein
MSNKAEAKTKGKKTKRQQTKSNDKLLCGKEVFYFLRSFCIVMFSYCKQSLDLSADAVFNKDYVLNIIVSSKQS